LARERKLALDRLIGAPLNLVRRKRIAAVPKKRHDGAARQHGIDGSRDEPACCSVRALVSKMSGEQMV
jgi:hypothetical protein